MQETVADRVRQARIGHGLTIVQLAHRARVRASEIVAIEEGRDITPAILPKLAAALSVDPLYLGAGYNPAARAIDVQRQWEREMQAAAGMATAGNLADEQAKRRFASLVWAALGFSIGLVVAGVFLAQRAA